MALQLIMSGVLLGQTGTISTIAGNGLSVLDDGIPTTSARLNGAAQDVALDGRGNLYVLENGRVRRVSPRGIITTAGSAANATHLAVDQSGTVFAGEPIRSPSRNQLSGGAREYSLLLAAAPWRPLPFESGFE